MKNRYKKLLPVVMAFLLIGCSKGQGGSTLVSPNETYEKAKDSYDLKIQDMDTLYKESYDTKIPVMYLTVGYGEKDSNTDHTWSEVNQYPMSYYKEKKIKPYKCEAVLQVGDEVGPLNGKYGYGELTPNATVESKGANSSIRAQKSYKIDIKKGKGKYEDMKSIALNKELTDPLRFTEKLSYRLMQDIPKMFSTKAQFVRLYVKDKSEGKDGLFVDYGLYTMKESINKSYFKNRNLDDQGSLYEVDNFDWQRHEDVICLATDKKYKKAKFEKMLGIKGDNDHQKLISMLDAVNNPDVSVDDFMENYFDEENLLTFLAYQILTGNVDSVNKGYSIYSPRGIDQFYFIIDNANDGFMKDYARLNGKEPDVSWKTGFFPFTKSILYQRILSEQKYLDKLAQIVEEMHKNYLNREKVEAYVGMYKDKVKETLYEYPDMDYARVTPKEYDHLVDGIYEQIEQNAVLFEESLKKPWPFHVHEPKVAGDKLEISWDESYCKDDEVTYDVTISDSYVFDNRIFTEKDVKGLSVKTDTLPEGQYFLRVKAKNGEEMTQDCFEFYNTEHKTTIYGTLCFYVFDDGTVAASYFDEEN